MRKTPFQKGPLLYQNRLQGEGWYYYKAKSSNRDQNKNIRFQNNTRPNARRLHHPGSALNGKNLFYNSKRGFCHQQLRTSYTNKDCNSRACTSNNKKVVYKNHYKFTISRKTTLLHNSLEKNYSGWRYIICCELVWNPICISPTSGENT